MLSTLKKGEKVPIVSIEPSGEKGKTSEQTAKAVGISTPYVKQSGGGVTVIPPKQAIGQIPTIGADAPSGGTKLETPEDLEDSITINIEVTLLYTLNELIN